MNKSKLRIYRQNAVYGCIVPLAFLLVLAWWCFCLFYGTYKIFEWLI